jgi:hypothetical protein
MVLCWCCEREWEGEGGVRIEGKKMKGGGKKQYNGFISLLGMFIVLLLTILANI